MPNKIIRLAANANRQEFQERIRFAMVKAALESVGEGESAGERLEYGARILRGDINLQTSALAVLVSIESMLPADTGNPGRPDDDPISIDDDMIRATLWPEGDITQGVFHKLAVANIRPLPGE